MCFICIMVVDGFLFVTEGLTADKTTEFTSALKKFAA